MNRNSQIPRGRWQQSFFVWLAWAMVTAWVAFPHTAFAYQRQEKSDIEVAEGTTLNHTAFTYQGQLKDASGPVNGVYDFRFTLYSAQTGGEQLGSIGIENLALTNGLFNVRLDFGRAVLEAKEGWLEIGVRPGGSAEPYTVLFPRQKLTPTPYAIFAQHEQWSLIGVPVGFVGDKGKYTDIISLDEKKVSAADDEASLAKPAEKALTSTTPDDGTVTAAANPAACAQPVVCDSPDPNPAFSATNQNPMGTGIVGLGGITGGYFKATASSGIRVGAYGIGDSAGLVGESNQSTNNASGVHGRNFGGGWGVWGHSSTGFAGVFGSGGQNGVYGNTANGDASGVYGRNDGANPRASWGVFGFSPNGFAGVFGSGGQNGVFGITNNRIASGVYGQNDGGGVGVAGFSASGDGVVGRSGSRNGVFGETSSPDPAFTGVWGRNLGAGQGVVGSSVNGDGILGETNNASRVGGFFRNNAGGLALFADGRAGVRILEITGGGDLAEPFKITNSEAIQPGLVVAIDPDQPGHLRIADKAYDRTVAGIISGANGINPGLTMKQEGTVADGAHPVALSGRVYCWADAANGPIEPGDLLTTSDTPGHAMKVTDHAKAQGAIIGKAMTGLKEGKGLVLVLVTLQ